MIKNCQLTEKVEILGWPSDVTAALEKVENTSGCVNFCVNFASCRRTNGLYLFETSDIPDRSCSFQITMFLCNGVFTILVLLSYPCKETTGLQGIHYFVKSGQL